MELSSQLSHLCEEELSELMDAMGSLKGCPQVGTLDCRDTIKLDKIGTMPSIWATEKNKDFQEKTYIYRLTGAMCEKFCRMIQPGDNQES